MNKANGTLSSLFKQSHAMQRQQISTALGLSKWLCGLLWVLTSALLPAQSVASEAPLKAEVAFWRSVFGELNTGAGLIHDERNLSVVYETLKVRKGIGWRKRQKYVDAAFQRYRTALERLANGKRTHLSQDEQRALDAWGPNTSNATFKSAAQRLRFQLGQSDRFIHGLEWAAGWREYIRDTFTAMGIPAVATAIPHVESSYNPMAVSSVGAKGVWQFTAGMGRRFMRVDHIVDERLDIYKATIAAGELLLHNHAVTGSWPLAITAYNHGTSGIRRAKKLLKTSSINTIVRQYRGPAFGFASRNFYAAVRAAHEVDVDYERYFGALDIQPKAPPFAYTLSHYMDIADVLSVLGLEEAALRELNPALLSPVWKRLKLVPKGHTLYLPCHAGECESMLGQLESVPAEMRYSEQRGNQKYIIQRGDTLIEIAASHRLEVEDILSLNSLDNVNKIRFGQTLLLPETETPPPLARLTPVSLSVDSAPRAIKKDIVLDADGNPTEPLTHEDRIIAPESIDALPSAPAREAPGIRVVPASREELPELVSSSTGGRERETEAQPIVQLREGDPLDYGVANDNSIEVQAEETLGHLAEWLNTHSGALRQLNGLSSRAKLRIGQHLVLDFSNATQAEFEQRRLDYHRGIQNAFFRGNIITDLKAHNATEGESLWRLANNAYAVPLWLLRQYNPELALDATLRVNTSVYIPVVKKRDYDTE